MNKNQRSAARNAPFGTDVQPKLNIKIIGGKAVEIAVDSPPSSAGNKKDLPTLQRGPHGTPPLQTQPADPNYDKDSRENKHREVCQSPTLIHLSTSPSDKSNSHRHGDGRRRGSFPGANPILPPIHSKPGIPNLGSKNLEKPIHHQSPVLPPPRISPAQPEINLAGQVKDHLKDYDPYRLKEMYNDLAEFDRKLTSYVSQAQLNMITLRHKLPIPTTILKLLFSSFTNESNPDLVNYEKLIQFLARAQLGSSNAETLLQESLQRFISNNNTGSDDAFQALEEQIDRFHHGEDVMKLKNIEAPHPHQQDVTSREQGSSTNIEDLYKEFEDQDEKKIYTAVKKPLKVFSDRENAKFLRLIEQQYAGGGGASPDFDAMREKFGEKDPDQQGIVTKKEIDEVCLFFRCPVQGSLMDKLLQRCDTGEGHYSWVTFVDFLERSQPINSSTSKIKIEVKESQRPTTWPTPNRGGGPRGHSGHLDDTSREVIAAPWESKKPLGRLETRSPKQNVSDVEKEITRNDTPTELHSSPLPLPSSAKSNNDFQREQLRALAHEHRKKREAQQRAAVMVQEQGRYDDEPWFERFMHLARGLYNSDSTNTGFLETEELYRLVKNYNLIYQLGLSSGFIQSVITRYAKHSQQVPIEPILEALHQHLK